MKEDKRSSLENGYGCVCMFIDLTFFFSPNIAIVVKFIQTAFSAWLTLWLDIRKSI